MKPILCKENTVVEVEGHTFFVVISCVIEQIEPEILVSDYTEFRAGPVNQRIASYELENITGQNLNAEDILSAKSSHELAILNKYTRTNNIVGKTVKVADLEYRILIVFEDNTYINKGIMEDRDGCSYTYDEPLHIDTLEHWELISQKDLDIMEQEKAEMRQYLATLDAIRSEHQEKQDFQRLSKKYA